MPDGGNFLMARRRAVARDGVVTPQRNLPVSRGGAAADAVARRTAGVMVLATSTLNLVTISGTVATTKSGLYDNWTTV